VRAAVLGSGGIGGYYGTLLARSGHDVAFIARGAHLEAMQGRGLTVRTSEGESTIPVTASADTASIGTVDLRMGGEGKLVFGELSGPVTERVQRIAEAFRQSIPQEVTTDIQRVLWDTFLFITGISGVTALARSGIGPLLASAAGCTLLRAACWEIVAVAQAEGALLQPAAVDTFLAQAPMLPAPWRSSMARALEEGRRLEVDALSGAVVRRGLKAGRPDAGSPDDRGVPVGAPAIRIERCKGPWRAQRFEPERGGGHATHGQRRHRDGHRIRHRRSDRPNVRA
jgi:ketopantoate reductase